MFPGGKKGMKELMKQAKKMQEELQKAQEEAESLIVEATSGGGMVKVKMNGKNQLLSIKIDPEVIDPDDIEMLEDLIVAAVNEAIVKVGKESEKKLSKVTGGLNIPGLF